MATIIKDNLTSQQRRLLYDADRYQVTELRCGFWLAEHAEVPALFSVARVNGRSVSVISNTLGEYVVSADEKGALHCNCLDACRAHQDGRHCKHGAVAAAVAEFCRVKRLPKVRHSYGPTKIASALGSTE